MRITRLTLAIVLPCAPAGGRSRLGVELLARLSARFGIGIALYHVAVLDERLPPAAQPLQRHRLLVPCVGELVAGGIVAHEVVPRGDRLVVSPLGEVALADP